MHKSWKQCIQIVLLHTFTIYHDEGWRCQTEENCPFVIYNTGIDRSKRDIVSHMEKGVVLFCFLICFVIFKEVVLGKGEVIENLPPVTQYEGCWCGQSDLIVLPLPHEVAYQRQ